MIDQHDDPEWLRHMGRMFRRWSKESEADFSRDNCLRLSDEFRKMAKDREQLRHLNSLPLRA